MDNINFQDVLNSYEEKVDNVDYSKVKKSKEELTIISNDINRTAFLSLDKNEMAKSKYLKYLLYDIISTIPNAYVQGMSEVASVFVYFYFSSEFDKYCININDSTETENNSSSETLKLDDARDEDYKIFYKGLGEKIEVVRVVLINVFTRKLEPLLKDNFQLYKEYAKVFIKMMSRRGVKIEETFVHQYMGSIFTFYSRDVTSMEDAYKIFEIILSCPPSSFFLILVVYYDTISKKELIQSVDANLYQSIILLEAEFVKTADNLARPSSGCFLSKNAIYIGGAIGLAIAVAVYKYNKRNDG